MKLQTQSSIYLSSFSLIVFVLIGIFLYSLLRKLSNDELDAILQQERDEVVSNPELLMIANQAGAPFFSRLIAKEISLFPGNDEFFYDSVTTLKETGQKSAIRCLRFYRVVVDQPVQFILYKSKLPAQQLVRQIIITITLIAVIFLLGIYLLNRFAFRRIWRDFYHTIRELNDYDPKKKAIRLPDSRINEFRALNKEIEKMTGRVTETYDNLNNFTSHTTHEIQTPLAVIRLKSELLMQTANLSDEQLQLIESIGDNSRHLSQLNRSLALLFKIDHHHYSSSGDFYPATGILRQLDNLSELIEIKELKLKTSLPPEVHLSMDPSLGDILVHNLVKNAIVHNQQRGELEADLRPGFLTIINSGAEPGYPTEHYFSEFVKGPESKGLGLGLALVRRICSVSGISVEYTWADGYHRIILRWTEK
jgi:two-component system, OmpR family, sensor histidine kinase QseC